jgi:preprotein translocase subunit YajC
MVKMLALLGTFLGITSAYAAAPIGTVAAPSQSGSGGGLMSLLPMLIIFILFMYFVMIRPQTKKAKEHNKLMVNLKKGDEIVTIAGMLGRIEKITDEFITVNIAENVNVSMRKNAISAVLPKGTIKSAE